MHAVEVSRYAVRNFIDRMISEDVDDIELTLGEHVTHLDATDQDIKDGETFTLAASELERTKKLLAQKNVSPEEIDLIVVASVTPDMLFPATACLVQDRIGAKNAWGFDLSAACSGAPVRSASVRARSSPVMPPSWTSTSRQPKCVRSGSSRNASAEPKVMAW